MRIALPRDPTSAALARQAVRRACEGLNVDIDVAMLCASELVTNAVLHGTPPIQLEITIEPSCVRVIVHDADRQPVARRRPVSDDTLSGRGLGIVEALASNWSSESTRSGKATWFQLTRGDASLVL